MPTWKKSVYIHKKFGKREFVSSFARDKKGERVFELTSKTRTITFESPQAAVALGWKKK
jgi:hypothetical protein